MKVLMFGWEFPPHITGGLGTASYGLTKGLTSLKDTELIFVVPKAYGDEAPCGAKLIGANAIAFTQNKVHTFRSGATIKYLEVASKIVPYVDPKAYWKICDHVVSTKYKTVQTDDKGRIPFTGNYGTSLYEEIQKYALVAEIIARDHHFDVIHAHDWLAYPAGMAAKHVSGKPLIVHVHATEFDRNSGNINPVVFDLEKEGMNAADHIIAVSNFTRNTIILKYDQDPDKVTTIHNAVEPIRTVKGLKIEKGLDEKIVTFLGRITSQKGPAYFIEAAALVLQRKKNVRFVMAGSGDQLEQMISYAASKHIADRFYFTGFLSEQEVYELFQLSDVYIMPSVSEPFGISPLEAMHANTPVIISKQSGVSELLTHALKVDYWDVPAMADAINALITYPALGAHIQKKGKKEVKKLRWTKVAQQVRRIYDKVLDN